MGGYLFLIPWTKRHLSVKSRTDIKRGLSTTSLVRRLDVTLRVAEGVRDRLGSDTVSRHSPSLDIGSSKLIILHCKDMESFTHVTSSHDRMCKLKMSKREL